MIRRTADASLALVLAVSASSSLAGSPIVDATGRSFGLPSRIERVYAAGPPASVLLLALAPDKLVGWTRAPRADEIPFLPPGVANLPELGRLTGRGNTANVEVILRARPDIILDVGSTSATFASLASRVQEQTGIPYLLFDGTLAETPRLLREVGRAVGVPDAGDALANNAEAQLREIAKRVATIPDARRPRVYFARGPNGLTTTPRGSMQAETLALAGGANAIEPPPGFAGNLVNVSLEDVLLAKPDIIIASDSTFATLLKSAVLWRDVPAVRAGRIHVVPDLPFGWFDSPPALNRLLGVQWLARVFHPQLFPEPLGPVIKAFHRDFYHREPTDAQVRALLDTAGIAQ